MTTWTPEQIRENNAKVARDAQAARENPRPVQKLNSERAANPDNLCGHAAKLSRSSGMPKGGSLKTPAWTPEEDALLIALYEQMKAGEINRIAIAGKIGRSEAACACRANELKITIKRGTHPRTDEYRVNISESQKARSPETRFDIAKFSKGKPAAFKGKSHTLETKVAASLAQKSRLKEKGHPRGMLGKPVSQETRDKIADSNAGRIVPEERTLRGLKTRVSLYGTLAPPHMGGGSWLASWREIGGQRIFARSRWEANYARYLQFLVEQGQILKWEHEPETFWFDKIKRGVRSYLPDFRVTHLCGKTIEYHEVKGWMDARSKTKIKRMAKYHPHIILRVIEAAWFRANRNLSGLIVGWEDMGRSKTKKR